MKSKLIHWYFVCCFGRRRCRTWWLLHDCMTTDQKVISIECIVWWFFIAVYCCLIRCFSCFLSTLQHIPRNSPLYDVSCEFADAATHFTQTRRSATCLQISGTFTGIADWKWTNFWRFAHCGFRHSTAHDRWRMMEHARSKHDWLSECRRAASDARN